MVGSVSSTRSAPWKHRATRNRELRKRGLTSARAWQSASYGGGPWWNAVSSHMNAACLKRYFDQLGLVALLSFAALAFVDVDASR